MQRWSVTSKEQWWEISKEWIPPWKLLLPCPDLLCWPSARIPQLLWCWRTKGSQLPSSPFSKELSLTEPGAAMLNGVLKVRTILWGNSCFRAPYWWGHHLTLAATTFKYGSSSALSWSPHSLLLEAVPQQVPCTDSLSSAFLFANSGNEQTPGYPLVLLKHTVICWRMCLHVRGPFNFLFFTVFPCIVQNQKPWKTMGSLNRTIMRTYSLEYKLFSPAPYC